MPNNSPHHARRKPKKKETASHSVKKIERQAEQTQDFAELQVVWQSENQTKVPRQFVYADDTLSVSQALKLVRQGIAIVWRGDYHQAKQCLAAMARHIDKARKVNAPTASATEQFNLHRLAQAQKAQMLGLLVLLVDYHVEQGLQIRAKRAPQIQEAAQTIWCHQATFAVSLREILGVIGAWEWRKKGVWIEALKAPIYPFYGVFSPIRGEYVPLLANTPLPQPCKIAFDIGSGTGVLSAVLARRGIQKIIAVDNAERAIACTEFNIEQLGLHEQVEVRQQAFFPEGRADLIVCNPPWLPSKSSSSLEAAVYDPNSRMLKGFLSGVAQHLTAQGQAWLIMSDLAEHLALRSRAELLRWIEEADLIVLDRHDVQPQHRKATDPHDSLSQARGLEATSLWRLGLKTKES